MSQYTVKQAFERYRQTQEILWDKGYRILVSHLSPKHFAELKKSNGHSKDFHEFIQFFHSSQGGIEITGEIIILYALPEGFEFRKDLGITSNIGRVSTLAQLAQNSCTNATSFYRWSLALPIHHSQ